MYPSTSMHICIHTCLSVYIYFTECVFMLCKFSLKRIPCASYAVRRDQHMRTCQHSCTVYGTMKTTYDDEPAAERDNYEVERRRRFARDVRLRLL